MGEFSFKEMKTWGQPRFHLVFCVWCESRELGGRGEFRILLCNPSGGNLVFMAKIPEREGNILPSSFYGQVPDCQSHVFSLSTQWMNSTSRE